MTHFLFLLINVYPLKLEGMPFLFLGFFGSILVSAVPEKSLSLQEYLELAKNQSEPLQAIDRDLQTLNLQKGTIYLSLSPELSGGFREIWDEKEKASANVRKLERAGDVGVQQKFITGTTIGVAGTYEAAKSGGSLAGKTHDWEWTASLSQSLLRDAFGYSTRLLTRSQILNLEVQAFDLQKRREDLYVHLEEVYWDTLLVQKEFKVREENLARSQKLLKWVKNRVSRQAADSTDLLQAQALLATRELEYQETIDRRETLRKEIEKYFPEVLFSLADASFSQVTGKDSLSPRSASLSVLRRDLLVEKKRAEFLRVEFQRQKNGSLPSLDAVLSAGTNGVEPTAGEAFKKSFGNPVYEVGFRFSTNLNFSLLSDATKAARIALEAQELRLTSLERDSKISWSEFWAQHARLNERIQIAQKLAQLQKEKSREEQRNYEKGKSTAFQAITFEQEASEAELMALRLVASLRKLEAQLRNFVNENGESL